MIFGDGLVGYVQGRERSLGASGESLGGSWAVPGVARGSFGVPGKSLEVSWDTVGGAWGLWELPGRSFVILGMPLWARCQMPQPVCHAYKGKSRF